MNCPQCGSKDIIVMSLQTHYSQVICNICRATGTYDEFGLLREKNVGLVTTVDGAELYIERSLLEPGDASKRIQITAHRINGISVCNTWICIHRQWLKLLVERTIDAPLSGALLLGEIIRLIQDPVQSEAIRKNKHYEWAVLSLMNAVKQIE